MSLATRCSSCGTVFRVVQDQLKVSEGWVRCGRCNEVFNALESLFDLGRDTPPEWSPSQQLPMAVSPLHASAASSSALNEARTVRIDAHLVGTRRSEGNTTPAARVDERDRLEFPDAQFEPDFDDEELIAPIRDSTLSVPPQFESEREATPAPPEFIRRAHSRARWQSPAVRRVLGLTCTALAALLTLQYAIHFRDVVAVRWPTSVVALNAWCAMAGCSISLPRRIEDIAVENTALTRASTPNAFRLAVTLRSRSTMALALPSIDLTLTEVTGRLVARRVLSPNEWRAGASALPAGGELPVQMVLSTANAAVTGYTVEVFYP